tara:strand:- start:1200 stop:1427 length:228 start_codon:yes stop_codon:yes gene_type:complete
MRIKKYFIYIALGAILSGCAQSTAMLGPAITFASTGNVSQAGFTFATNKAVKKKREWIQFHLFQKKLNKKILKLN